MAHSTGEISDYYTFLKICSGLWRSALAHNPLGNYHKSCEPQPLEVKNIKMYSSVVKYQFVNHKPWCP